MDKISVLQLGNEDWSSTYAMPPEADWVYESELTKIPKRPYCLVFIDKIPSDDEIKLLQKCTKAYCLYVRKGIDIQGNFLRFCISKICKLIRFEDIGIFLKNDLKYYFPKSYGEKFRNNNLGVAYGFKGSIKWHGNCGIELTGDYGEEYNQLAMDNLSKYHKEKVNVDLYEKYSKELEIDNNTQKVGAKVKQMSRSKSR